MRRLVAVRVEVLPRGSAEPVGIPSEQSRAGLDDQPAVLHSAVAPVSPGADRMRSQSRSQRHESKPGQGHVSAFRGNAGGPRWRYLGAGPGVRSMIIVAEFVAVTVWPVVARQQRRVATLACKCPYLITLMLRQIPASPA